MLKAKGVDLQHKVGAGGSGKWDSNGAKCQEADFTAQMDPELNPKSYCQCNKGVKNVKYSVLLSIHKHHRVNMFLGDVHGLFLVMSISLIAFETLKNSFIYQEAIILNIFSFIK